MIVKRVVRYFGNLISQAEQRAIETMLDGRVETEPAITDRLIGDIEAVLAHSRAYRGVIFRARTLRDRGTNAAEHLFGADICGVLRVGLTNYSVSKGVLIQAKLERPGSSITVNANGEVEVHASQSQEHRRMTEQLDRMLSITPASFVIVYSVSGFRVVPASSLNALIGGGALYAKGVRRFFEDYIMCFLGDGRLSAHDDDSLEALRLDTVSQRAVMIEAKEGRAA